MTYYSGEAPEGASAFEAVFGLMPMGDEVTPERLARLETIAGLFVSAAVDPSSQRARVWVGSFAPSQYELPVPSETAIGEMLDQFRSQEERVARHEAAYADFND